MCKEDAPLGQYCQPHVTRWKVHKNSRKFVFFSGRARILVNYELKRSRRHKDLRMTLLHEMCHMALPAKVEHGPAFNREMLRLARMGAFDGLW